MAQTRTVHTLERARDAFADIRQAIETKLDTSLDEVPVERYDNIIENMPDEPRLDTLTVTPSTNEQTIVPEQGYDGFNEINVDAVDNSIDSNIVAGNIKKDVEILGIIGTYEGGGTSSLQNKTITPSTSQQVISADAGYDGLDEVTVEAVNNSIDQNIVASNIKKDVSILGVTGTYEGSGGQITFTDLSYLFYKGYRSPSDYWHSVVEPSAPNCVGFELMCAEATMGAGTFELDLSNITNNSKIQMIFNAMRMNGIASMTIKLNGALTSLYQLFGSMYGDANNYLNVDFDENGDASGIVNINTAFGGVFGTLDLTELKNNHFTNLIQAFMSCNVVTDLVGIEDFDITGVTTLEGMFKYFNNQLNQLGNEPIITSNFNTIDMSNWDFTNIILMTDMFNGAKVQHIKFNPLHTFTNIKLSGMCYGADVLIDITGLNIQESTYNSRSERVHSQAFANCPYLERITSNSKWIIHSGAYKMYSGDYKLESIPEIDIVIHNAGYRDTTESMFQYCRALEEVTINISYADATPHPMYCQAMFNECNALKYIKGNLDLTYVYNASQLNSQLFQNCNSLEKITTTGEIAKNVTSTVTLDLSASAVFDIADYISQLAANTSGYTRNIKLNATVYGNLTQAVIDAATAKSYTLVSA